MSINSINTNITSNRPIRDSQSTNNGVINRPRTPSFNASTVNASVTVPTSNQLLENYANVNAWKNDRAALFNKYKEADNKVSVPTRIILSMPSTPSAPEANPTERTSILNRSSNPTPSITNRQSTQTPPSIINREPAKTSTILSRPNQISEVAEPTKTLVKISEEEVRSSYGNYFVYRMESFIGKIMRSEESIKASQKNAAFNELGIANSTDEASNNASRSIIASATSAITESEEQIRKTLTQITRWASVNNVMDEAKSFIAEFTRDYYNNPQTFESIQSKYS